MSSKVLSVLILVICAWSWRLRRLRVFCWVHRMLVLFLTSLLVVHLAFHKSPLFNYFIILSSETPSN
jgi:hypothetical protein